MNFQFTVPGIPVTQGSIRASIHKHTGRAIAIQDHRGPLLNWRNAISWTAKQAMPEGWPMDLPVAVYATFYLPRPKSAPKRVVNPVKKPDLDKLARALLDSLTGVVINDDSQVIHMVLYKQFADVQHPAGVWVEVEAL